MRRIINFLISIFKKDHSSGPIVNDMSKDNEELDHSSKHEVLPQSIQLSDILSFLRTINGNVYNMSTQLVNLQAEVANSVQTQQAIVALLTRVVEYITSNAVDPAALDALTQALAGAREALAAGAAGVSAVIDPTPQP